MKIYHLTLMCEGMEEETHSFYRTREGAQKAAHTFALVYRDGGIVSIEWTNKAEDVWEGKLQDCYAGLWEASIERVNLQP